MSKKSDKLKRQPRRYFKSYMHFVKSISGLCLALMLGITTIQLCAQTDTVAPGVIDFQLDKSKIIRKKAGTPVKTEITVKYNFQKYAYGDELSTGPVYDFLQDKRGNIWMAHFGGGLSCYNGQQVKKYGKKEGLPDTRVLKITEDVYGNIWLTLTAPIVVKYNGHEFISYYIDSLSQGKPIRNMFADESGKVWISVIDGGLIYYEEGTFRKFDKHPWFIDGKLTVNSIDVDDNGAYWFGSHGGGLMKWEDEEFTIYNSENSSLINNNIFSSIKDKEGTIWYSFIGETGKLLKNRNGAFEQLDLNLEHDIHMLFEVPYWSMEIDACGNLWLATYQDGVVKYKDGKSVLCSTENGLSSNGLHAVFMDKEDNIWFGTEEGVDKLKWGFIEYYDIKGVSGFIEDKKGNLWIGLDSRGIIKYDGVDFYAYTTQQGLLTNNMISFAIDEMNRLFFIYANEAKFELGIFDGEDFTFINEEAGWKAVSPHRQMASNDSSVWFCDVTSIWRFDGEKFTKYDHNYLTSDGSHAQVVSIYEEEQGVIWVGMYDQPLLKIAAEERFFYGKEEGLDNTTIVGLEKDSLSNIWMTTYGGGIKIFNGEKFTHLTTENGLKDDMTLGVSKDRENDIWITDGGWLTKVGITYNDKKGEDSLTSMDYSFRYYGKTDGIQNHDLSSGGLSLDRNNVLWMTGNERIVRIDPSFDKPNRLLANNSITGLQLFNEYIDWRHSDSINGVKFNGVVDWKNLPKDLVLSYDQNSLSFSFVGITTTHPEKVRYKWILEGQDENWSPVTDKTTAYYTNISPGDYTFKVISSNSDGIWNETAATFSFTVNPPWWSTWWARLLGIIAILGVIIFIYRIRVRTIKEKNRLLEVEVKNRTAELSNRTVELSNKKEELETKNKELNDTIEELNSTQKLLVESEKMAVLGQLVAAVAHELNTPLAAIKSSTVQIEESIGGLIAELSKLFEVLNKKEIELFLEFVNQSAGDIRYYSTREERKLKKELYAKLSDQQIAEAQEIAEVLTDIQFFNVDINPFLSLFKHDQNIQIAEIARSMVMLHKSNQIIFTAIEKSTKVVFALKSYSRFDRANKLVDVNIIDNLETVIVLYGNYLKQGIELERNFEEVGAIKGYPDELNQVWSNLIQNALHAMSNKGKLKISIKDIGNYLELKFQDSGVGIPEENLQDVFKPFYTTKGHGEGSGLGLNIVEKIIIKHRGKISVESEKGKTVFTILMRKDLEDSNMHEE